MNSQHLEITFFCDHEHSLIKALSKKLEQNTDTDLQFIKNAYFYVRDEIRFGGDTWRVKASETLKKRYGACYNKNLLLMAVLRQKGIPCQLGAHPMSRTFTQPCTGLAHRFFSHPFYHCFSLVRIGKQWIHVDPTLDKNTYDTFFRPRGVSWNIQWNEKGMPPLYQESIIGESVVYKDIDEALETNLNSWYLFKHEPDFIARSWIWLGNYTMWKQTDKFIVETKNAL